MLIQDFHLENLTLYRSCWMEYIFTAASKWTSKGMKKPDSNIQGCFCKFIWQFLYFQRRDLLKNDKYPHIVNEETAMISNPQENSLNLNVNVNGLSISDMEGSVSFLFNPKFQEVFLLLWICSIWLVLLY